jgi:APA family basic amino acid/polyamine antiporter
MTRSEDIEKPREVEPTLLHGHASIRAVTVLGLAAMQIGPGIALAGGYMIFYAGDASWVAMALALLAAAAIAVALATFSRRMVATGGLISYIGATLGPIARAFTAAGYLCGMLISVAAVTTGVVIFTASFLTQVGVDSASSGVAQALSAIVLSVAAAALAYRGLDASVRVSSVLTFAAIPFVLWVTVAAALNVDFDVSSQFDFGSDAFSLSIVVPSVIIASANFVGFDGMSALAGETVNPRRNVPRLLAMLLTVCGLSYIVMIWVQLPALNSGYDLLEAGESPTAVLAEVGGVGFLAAPMDLLLAAATFAGLVAVFNYGSRIVATAAADGLIPRSLARIHPVHRSPSAAIVFMGVIGAGIPILLQLVSSSPPLESSVYLYTFYAYFYLLPYVLAAVAAVVLLVRERSLNPVRIGVILAGGVAWAYVLWYALSHPGGGVFTALPWLMLGMTFGLFLIFVVAHLRNPQAGSQMDELL